MALRDIKRPAVLAAIEEFDRLGRSAFLDRYGFDESRSFWLRHDGRDYDSKAIVGVAHGHLPGRQALRADEFSGGAATVQSLLEELGFDVVVDAEVRRYDWTREEVILALGLYVASGARRGAASPPGATAPAVVELSRVLNALEIHPRSGRGPKFRNPNGVAQKLGNLRAAERAVALERGLPDAEELPRGNPNLSRIDVAVMAEFWDRWDELEREAERLHVMAQYTSDDATTASAVAVVSVEATHSTMFEARSTAGGIRQRSESVLRDEYVEAMRQAGHEVVGLTYQVAGEAARLRCDVFVESLNLLVEAKASDERGAIRYAVGQLMDYAMRHDEPRPDLAVLVPYKPREDLLQLLSFAGVECIWPTRGGGFRDTVRGRLCS